MLLNADQLNQIRTQLRERGKALTAQIERLEARQRSLEAQLEADRKERVSRATDATQRAALRGVLGDDQRRQLSASRRKLVEESRETRARVMANLDHQEAQIEATRNLFKSPQQVLHREGLGDPRRSELQRQLENAGPATIRSMADLAIAQADRVLAAAILAVEDRKSRSKRTLDIAKFSATMVGTETEEMQRALDDAQLLIDSMCHVNSSFERGVANSVERIALGLAKRRLERNDDPDALGRAVRAA